MIKDILVHLNPGGRRDAGAEFAVSVASLFGASLTGVAYAYEPIIPPSIFGAIPAELVAAQKQQSVKAAETAVARFTDSLRRADLHGGTRLLDASVSASGDLFGRLARVYDLSIVTQAEPESLGTEDLVIEGALFEAGRPVMVVPYIQTAPIALDRVLLAWDGSRQAARACADALPFLTRAGRVDVVMVASERLRDGEMAGVDVAQHLARHDIKVEVKRLADSGGIGETLLSYAATSGGNLLVMGGYGHSRLREFVLGGATRGILDAMTLPVLLSH
jgi:nucleotide-binding universal stress UspA family protein